MLLSKRSSRPRLRLQCGSLSFGLLGAIFVAMVAQAHAPRPLGHASLVEIAASQAIVAPSGAGYITDPHVWTERCQLSIDAGLQCYW